ncbi:MAG TPA: diacylglycerol kinase family protein [Anaerolineales bacterium]
MSRRTKLIFNPHADRGHAWDIAQTFNATLDRYGGGDWAATEFPGQATELTEQAVRDGFEVIAALGGDGTVHEVVNGLMKFPAEQRPLLAAVPVGSGNDFCANVGLPHDPDEAILRVFEGQPRWIDLASISDNRGRTEYWDNTISIGFGASVAIYAYAIRRLRGFPMYLWAVIKTIFLQHNAPLMRFETDAETFEQNTLMISLNNGPREGGGFLTSPDAVPDDGQLNYAMIEEVSRPMMFRLIPEVMNGTHGRFKVVRLGAFKRMKINSAAPVPIHTDGEIFADFLSDVTELQIEVIPKAIQVLV